MAKKKDTRGQSRDHMLEIGKDTRFSKTRQPKKRRKATGINAALREFLDSKSLEINITMTDGQGRKKTNKMKFNTNGKDATIGSSIAATLLGMALNGNMQAIKEVMDRTEGRVPFFSLDQGEAPPGEAYNAYQVIFVEPTSEPLQSEEEVEQRYNLPPPE